MRHRFRSSSNISMRGNVLKGRFGISGSPIHTGRPAKESEARTLIRASSGSGFRRLRQGRTAVSGGGFSSRFKGWDPRGLLRGTGRGRVRPKRAEAACAENLDERAAEAADWSRIDGNRQLSCQPGCVLSLMCGLKACCLARVLPSVFPSLPPSQSGQPIRRLWRDSRWRTLFNRAHSDGSSEKEQCTEGEEKVDRR